MGISFGGNSGVSQTWTLLSDTTLGAAATFDISGLSAAKMFKCVLFVKETQAGGNSLIMNINNNSANSYVSNRFKALGGTVTGGSTTYTGAIIADFTGNTTFDVHEIDIFDLDTTSGKKWVARGVTADTSNSWASAGYTPVTAAITRIAFSTNGADTTFQTGSRLLIYGLVN